MDEVIAGARPLHADRFRPDVVAMPEARGEKIVRSLPRSFCIFNCGSTLFRSCSSLMPRSVEEAGARSREPRELLVAERRQLRRLGRVVAVDVDDHRG